MTSTAENRECPDCKEQMVSQQSKYKAAGIFVTILAVALAVFGVVILISSQDTTYGLLVLAAGLVAAWGGIRRIQMNPWVCPNCKTKEFV